MKALGVEGNEQLVGLCKKMYDEGVWPEDFTKVVMIPLQKKREQKNVKITEP